MLLIRSIPNDTTYSYSGMEAQQGHKQGRQEKFHDDSTLYVCA